MSSITRWFCILMILLLAAPALAGEEQPHKCFSSVDLDHDGKLTPAELHQAYPGLDQDYFKGLDQDDNGLLNHDEYHDALGHGSLGK